MVNSISILIHTIILCIKNVYVFDKIIIDMQNLDPPVFPLLKVLLDVCIAPSVIRNSEMFQKAWFVFLFMQL